MSSSISATTIKVGNALITAVNTAINLPPNSQVNGVPIQGIMSTITENSAGGSLALYLNTTGDYNTAIGANAGKISNGDNNTYFGASAGVTGTGNRNTLGRSIGWGNWKW